MKRSIFIVILAAVLIVILVFLLRRDNPTDVDSQSEVKAAPARKFQASRAGKTANTPPQSPGAASPIHSTRISENGSSHRSPILSLENLRALAAKSKEEAGRCSRKLLDPVEKKFQRLASQVDADKYRRQAEQAAEELSDIPTITPSSSIVLDALGGESGRKLSDREFLELASSLKYCDAIGLFNVTKAMFALSDRFPEDRTLKAILSRSVIQLVFRGGHGRSNLLHQFMRIEMLRGALRTGLIDASQSTLIDMLAAEQERIREDVHKDFEAMESGGESARAFRGELEHAEQMRAKINEALGRL